MIADGLALEAITMPGQSKILICLFNVTSCIDLRKKVIQKQINKPRHHFKEGEASSKRNVQNIQKNQKHQIIQDKTNLI